MANASSGKTNDGKDSSWMRLLEGHGFGAVAVVIAGLAMLAPLGASVGFPQPDETSASECPTLRDDEVRRSEEALVLSVEHQLDLDTFETDRLISELESLDQESEDEKSEDDTSREEAISRVRVAALREVMTRDRLMSLYGSIPAPLDGRSGDQAEAADELETLLADVGVEQLEIALSDRTFIESRRSVVNLKTDGTFPAIALGSSRDGKRQEITLTGSAGSPEEQGSGGSASQLRTHGPLLDEPDYKTDFGQFVSEDGNEIPRGSIHVWARRVGSNVLLSVCIDPKESLGAGLYKGKVYLDDPKVGGDSVSVSVTAQARRIELLYLLLIVLPPFAMAYVWYATEQPQVGNSFKFGDFFDWMKKSFVILLGVGLASIWTALQVAFNNPTLGSSLFGAVAVVGGAAVAAVTAMTTIAVTAAAARRRAAPKAPGPPGSQT